MGQNSYCDIFHCPCVINILSQYKNLVQITLVNGKMGTVIPFSFSITAYKLHMKDCTLYAIENGIILNFRKKKTQSLYHSTSISRYNDIC